MDNNFKLRANLKTDEELHECIDNREKYLPETVEAAVSELKYRGVAFSDEELKVIVEDMQARRELAQAGTDSFSLFSNSEANNQVEDPEAPAYFSKRAILVFSILLSVFFGAVMLAVNLSKTTHKDKALWVVLYGLGFTITVSLLAQNFGLNSVLALVTGFLGAYSLEALFWNKYIGSSALYKPRPIWVPLIIGIAIVVPVVILTLYKK